MSYGPDLNDQYRRAAGYVELVLEQPPAGIVHVHLMGKVGPQFPSTGLCMFGPAPSASAGTRMPDDCFAMSCFAMRHDAGSRPILLGSKLARRPSDATACNLQCDDDAASLRRRRRFTMGLDLPAPAPCVLRQAHGQ